VTLAFDRDVKLNENGAANNTFEDGEDFEMYDPSFPGPTADDVIRDLDLYLVPKGLPVTSAALCEATAKDSTIEHLFCQVPNTANGEYEILVRQFDNDTAFAGGQDYAIAWWAANTAANEGNYDGNSSWDVNDLDILTQAIAAGSTDLTFDLNGDGVVSIDDVTDPTLGWLAIGGARNPDDTDGFSFLIGDANLDGAVNGQDYVAWNDFKFTSTSKWSEGDFTFDGFNNGQDFVAWNDNKFLSSGPLTSPVPESGSCCLLLFCTLFLQLRRTFPKAT
jgi:hypothetical protein